MPRKARVAPGGLVYHVLNRAVGKLTLFRTGDDFAAFERVMIEAHERFPLRILSYCLMPNHWHFVVWPVGDADVTDYFRWLTHTHAMRWRTAHQTVGYGPLYQGRFKSFPIQRDEHVLAACRYVERNALTATLVRKAEDWPHSSLRARAAGGDELHAILSEWPVDRPRDWVQTVNAAQSKKELDRLTISETRGRPFGSDAWIAKTVAKLQLEHTVRKEGRPPKAKEVKGSEN